MTKLLFPIAAAFAMSAIAPAHSATPGRTISFESDGVKYEAHVVSKDDGSRLITGRDLTHGTNFSLKVANGQVNGQMGGQPVSYAVPKPGSVKISEVSLVK